MTKEEILFQDLKSITGPKEERRKVFAEVTMKHLRANEGKIYEMDKIFKGGYKSWVGPFLLVLGDIQHGRLMKGYELSVNSDYSKFYVFRI